VYDYGVNKVVENLPQLRTRMAEIIDNYHNVQQDILETFIDRGQLRKLAAPTVLPSGKRIPGLKLDQPRQLAVMHALVRFANIAAGGNFTTADLYAPTPDALGLTESQYSLASLRYDLAKLRAKGLLEKVPRSRRYRLVGKGYSICVVFLKLFEKIYAPLTTGLLAPFSRRPSSCRGETLSTRSTVPMHLRQPRHTDACDRSQDRRLNSGNGNKILVGAPITATNFHAIACRTCARPPTG
jgi:hypothetical protein